MKKVLLAFVFGCAVIATAGYFMWQHSSVGSAEKLAELQREVSEKNNSLLGYTKYSDYITAGKKTLVEQTKFLAATLTRPYRVYRTVEEKVLGIPSKGAVIVDYSVEYSFGYDLKPDGYEVVDTGSAIEIRIPRPTLLASPAVKNLRYEIVSSGWLTDEKVAALKLYEGTAGVAEVEGRKLAAEPEVVALCEKKVIAFFRDFLAKQPGVKLVPAITVAYKGQGTT